MWCIKGVGYYAKSLVMWCIKGVGHYAKNLVMCCIKGVGHYAKSLVMWCIKGVGSNHVEVEQKKLYLYIADMAEWSKTLNIRL